MTRRRMIFCRGGLGVASNIASWMRLRETQGNGFLLSDEGGLRSKKATKAEDAVEPDSAQHRQDKFVI
jgi:hypothetical protein